MAYEWKYNSQGNFLEMKLLHDGEEIAEFVALQERDGEGYLLEHSVTLFLRWRKIRIEEAYAKLTAPGIRLCDAAILAETRNKLVLTHMLPGNKSENEVALYAHSTMVEELKEKIRGWIEKLNLPKERVH